MNLNINGKLPRFYQWNYGDLPNDFCTYFWKLLFALLLSPITWWTYPAKNEGFVWRVVFGLITWCGVILLAYGISEIIATPEYFYLTLKIGIICIAVSIALAALIALVIGALWLYVKYFPDAEESKPSIIQEAIQTVKAKKNAVKDSYCPRINWL